MSHFIFCCEIVALVTKLMIIFFPRKLRSGYSGGWMREGAQRDSPSPTSALLRAYFTQLRLFRVLPLRGPPNKTRGADPRLLCNSASPRLNPTHLAQDARRDAARRGQPVPAEPTGWPRRVTQTPRGETTALPRPTNPLGRRSAHVFTRNFDAFICFFFACLFVCLFFRTLRIFCLQEKQADEIGAKAKPRGV